MEIASTIILLIGLIILGWYQKGRIKILERDIASQKSILVQCLKSSMHDFGNLTFP